MEKEEKETRRHYGIVNFERRKYPRFRMDLPIEYARTHLPNKHGQAINAGEGGLLLYLSEEVEVGQHLRLKLFFSLGDELKTIETEVEVVWMDIYLGKEWGDYRTGVKFVDISLEDLNSLKSFLRSLCEIS